jgi:hypothetical protein
MSGSFPSISHGSSSLHLATICISLLSFHLPPFLTLPPSSCSLLHVAHPAAHLAYNAIIYFELSNARRTNYKFSFEAMLNMKGNTAMYLVYAYARIRYGEESGKGEEAGGRQEGGRREAGGRREVARAVNNEWEGR